MSSAILLSVANSSGYKGIVKYSPLTLNWRVIIGVFLAVVIIFLYRLSSSKSPMESHSTESQGYLEWEGHKDGIFYRQAVPASSGRFTVLFLHGQAFNSKTWEDLGTLKYLNSKNYKAVAVDLPGYVNSRNIETPKTFRECGDFVQKLIEKLHIERPVLVSPSVSGSFSLPFIFEGDRARNLRGYVPVAPVGTEKFAESAYKSLELRTLIVYGENDRGLGIASLERLKNIPGSVIHVMKGAGHACYLNNGEEFHVNLVKFLEQLQ